MLESEVDARVRSGCQSQKWMPESEVDARVRSGCQSQKWMPESEVDAEQEQGWKVESPVKINKKRIGPDCCIVGERRN